MMMTRMMVRMILMWRNKIVSYMNMELRKQCLTTILGQMIMPDNNFPVLIDLQSCSCMQNIPTCTIVLKQFSVR
jgi:hypothetical protein